MSKLLSKLKGLRTIIAGVIVAAAPVVLELLDFVGVLDLSTVLTPKAAAAALFGVGILKIILRLMTDTPVGKRSEEDA